jgi:hypothetical protein
MNAAEMQSLELATRTLLEEMSLFQVADRIMLLEEVEQSRFQVAKVSRQLGTLI